MNKIVKFIKSLFKYNRVYNSDKRLYYKYNFLGGYKLYLLISKTEQTVKENSIKLIKKEEYKYIRSFYIFNTLYSYRDNNKFRYDLKMSLY